MLNEDDNWSIQNMGKSRYLTSEFEFDKEKFIQTKPDFFIINLGCVDAPPREIPLWYSDIIFKRKNLNFFKLANFIYLYIIKKFFRRILILIRFNKSWVNKENFQINIKNIISTLKDSCESKLIFIGINKGNQRIEKSLPGILERYKAYNKILEKVSIMEGTAFVDVSDLESDKYFPDGIHYNVEGHKIIAQRLYQCIKINNE